MTPTCYFCGKEVSESDFCHGCGKYVCSVCDQTQPMGDHEAGEHQEFV